FAGLGLVGIAFRDGAGWNAVSSEQDRNFASLLGAGFAPVRAQLLGECLNQQRIVMPLLDKINGKRGILSKQRLLIRSDTSARIMRREANCNRVSYTVGCHTLQGIPYVRMPIAHANVNRNSKLLLYS